MAVLLRMPLTTAAQVEALDDDEVIEGYFDGRNGDPEPGDNRSVSYWHGWRNGAVDGGHREIDQHQRVLAHNYLKRPRP